VIDDLPTNGYNRVATDSANSVDNLLWPTDTAGTFKVTRYNESSGNSVNFVGESLMTWGEWVNTKWNVGTSNLSPMEIKYGFVCTSSNSGANYGLRLNHDFYEYVEDSSGEMQQKAIKNSEIVYATKNDFI
jgi:hypothetical protein